jgi:hypothetical protein
MLERFIKHLSSHEGVTFSTMVTSCNVGRPNILSPRLFLIHASDEARAMILHLLYTVFTRLPL